MVTRAMIVRVMSRFYRYCSKKTGSGRVMGENPDTVPSCMEQSSESISEDFKILLASRFNAIPAHDGAI